MQRSAYDSASDAPRGDLNAEGRLAPFWPQPARRSVVGLNCDWYADMFAPPHGLRKLLGCLAIKVLGVGFGLCPRAVDHAVAVIGRRIERVELERLSARVDDVVLRPCGNDERVAGLHRRANAIQHHLATALFNPKELVELVHFGADFFIRLQCHDHKLAVLGGVEHLAEVFVPNGDGFDILYVTLHGTSV